MKIPVDVVHWAPLVKRVAHAAVNRDLVLAVIWKESEGNPWAYRPEPRYPYLWNTRTRKPFRKQTTAELSSEVPPLDWPFYAGSATQEWWAQQASWGLMQIMGAAARERGFTGEYLTELSDPAINIAYGSSHLWFWGYGSGTYDMHQALVRYNGQEVYAIDVLAKYETIRLESVFV